MGMHAKAHKVDADGGAEACSSTHASGSRHIGPGRPPAAAGGLGSQVPDLVLGWPSAAADSGELQQAGRRDTTRFFAMGSDHGVGGVHRLGSLGCHTGPSEPRVDELTSRGKRSWSRLKAGITSSSAQHPSDSYAATPLSWYTPQHSKHPDGA